MLLLQEYIKNRQNPSKKAKNTAAGTNILLQKIKILLFPPPTPRDWKFALYTRVVGLQYALSIEQNHDWSIVEGD